jgi:hypothetical protein
VRRRLLDVKTHTFFGDRPSNITNAKNSEDSGGVSHHEFRRRGWGLRTPDWSPTTSAIRRTSQLRYFIHGRDRAGEQQGEMQGGASPMGLFPVAAMGKQERRNSGRRPWEMTRKNLGAIVGLGSQGR